MEAKPGHTGSASKSPISGKWRPGADLSVLISTRNRSSRLRETLEAISRCRIPVGVKWELVLVNHNCTDDTDEVVESLAGKLPILYVREIRGGLSRARNAGLAAASGELIIFTDDDVEPNTEWIAAYWSGYQERAMGFYFGGPVHSRFESAAPHPDLFACAPPDVRGLDWGSESRELKRGEYFIGASWACPAGALRVLGGFNVNIGPDPSLRTWRVGEETDLMERLRMAGYVPWYVPQANVRHFVPASKCTLRYIAARGEADGFYRTGRSVETLDGPRILGLPRWMYREAASRALTYSGAKLAGRTGAQEYVRFRQTIGMMKAFRQLAKGTGSVGDRDMPVTN